MVLIEVFYLLRYSTIDSVFVRDIMPNRMRELNANQCPAVSFSLREITHICRDMKKRAPGSEGEREAAEYMAKSLEKDCGCTDVRVETFKEHPASFYSYFYFSATFDTLCAVSFFIRPWLSINCNHSFYPSFLL